MRGCAERRDSFSVSRDGPVQSLRGEPAERRFVVPGALSVHPTSTERKLVIMNILATMAKPLNFKHMTFAVLIFIGCGSISNAMAWTTFFKVADMVTVWTSDYTSDDTYFVWEARNVKHRLKMTRRYDSVNAPRGARLKLEPHVDSSSFAIVSAGQIIPFPMPRYENKSTVNPDGDMIPRPYNEIQWTDVSTDDDMVLEAKWTTLEGAAKERKLTGRAEITDFYKTVTDLSRTLPASNLPQYLDTLFPGERILLTKSNIHVMKADLEKLIKTWMEKQKKSNTLLEQSTTETPTTETPTTEQPAGPPTDVPESFIANGPQGEASFDFTKNGGVFTIKNGVNAFQTKWGRRSMYQVVAGAGAAGKIGGKPGLTTLPSLAMAKAGGLDYSQKSRIVGNGEVVVFVNPYGKYVAVKVMKVEDAVLGGSRNRVTIRWKVLQ